MDRAVRHLAQTSHVVNKPLTLGLWVASTQNGGAVAGQFLDAGLRSGGSVVTSMGL